VHSRNVLGLLGVFLASAGAHPGEAAAESGAGFAERGAAHAWSRAIESEEPVPRPKPLRFVAGTEAGRWSLLTYNVAGLPELRMDSEPEANAALISPLLNHYDVALVQEDFRYHPRLAGRAAHVYRSEPMQRSSGLMPDGLNWFSRFAFGWVQRVRWEHCNGYTGAHGDCLVDKGFSFAEIELREGLVVDVYNLHAEAGRAPEDVEVRRQNFQQLAEYMRKRPRRHAAVVAGDTNLNMAIPRDKETLEIFLTRTGMRDACRRFGCGEERGDRVLFRSSRELEVDVLGWWTDPRFVDLEGAPLSDHAAVGVELSWRVRTEADRVAGR
jgi:endonuclease/exonuclease/phosphatase family metal-dependent hydrolase